MHPALLQSKPDPQINESQPETRQRAHPCSREFRCCLCGYEARRHSPMPLISCRLFRRLLSSAMAFSICCRDPSSSPFSSSAGPTALHKPGKDAISELGSWQSELTASDGTGSRLTDKNTPPALPLIYPGTTLSSRRKGAAGGRDRRALLRCPNNHRQVGLLRETPVLLLFRSAGNTPHTSCNNTRLLKGQGTATAGTRRSSVRALWCYRKIRTRRIQWPCRTCPPEQKYTNFRQNKQ